jgi:hypothetical protein
VARGVPEIGSHLKNQYTDEFDSRVDLMGRISIIHVAAAIKKVRGMGMPQRIALAEEISKTQPNLLACCLVQTRLGLEAGDVDILLNILLVCYQAMKESGYQWPVISEEEQERHLKRHVGAVLFSEQMTDPIAADQARGQYLSSHPEQPLLAYALNEANHWLVDVAQRGAEVESDKYLMMAAINLVNCIAYADAGANPST